MMVMNSWKQSGGGVQVLASEMLQTANADKSQTGFCIFRSLDAANPTSGASGGGRTTFPGSSRTQLRALGKDLVPGTSKGPQVRWLFDVLFPGLCWFCSCL